MNRKALLLLALVCGFSTNVLALEDDESFTTYESIVSELKASAEEYKPMHEEPDWSAVALHGGLSLTGSYVSIEMPEYGLSTSGLLKGFEAHIGSNLFSRDARAELAFRNFAHDGLSNMAAADLRELEARVVFLPMLQEKTLLRMGAGVSERFFKLQLRDPSMNAQRSWATPYYTLLLGFERKIAKTVAIGPDFSHHAPLDASSYSKSSWDASFRLNATF